MQNKPIAFVWLYFVALLLAPVSAIAQTLTINTSLCGCQPVAGSPCPGATNYQMCTFAFNITSGCPSFTAINGFTTSGTYVASDILNFKLYETNFSVFNTSTLVATIVAGLGPGAHTFSGFNRTTCAAAQRYYWITCDFSPTAVSGHTIKIDLITAAMYAVTGTVSYGTNTAAGLQTICNPLPVSLVSFAAHAAGENTRIEWETDSETNNDYFTLERSEDGTHFTELEQVDGAGNSSQHHHYTVIDHHTTGASTIYYRLKQTDFNGNYEYTGGVITADHRGTIPVTVAIADQHLIVRGSIDPVGYTICDITGRILLNGITEPGESSIDISSFARGTYIIRFSDSAGTTLKFLITE